MSDGRAALRVTGSKLSDIPSDVRKIISFSATGSSLQSVDQIGSRRMATPSQQGPGAQDESLFTRFKGALR